MFQRLMKRLFVQPPRRGRRLSVEALEDRTTPHSGVTAFSAGITPNAAPAGIVRGPDDNNWFAEFGADRIARITATGVTTEFAVAAGAGPLNLVVGPDNNIWFTENTGDRIGRINPLAGSDAAIQASVAEFAVPGAGSAPNGIAAGPDGALWFTESGSDQIGRITTAGVVTNEFAVPGTGSTPAGIAAGATGDLWFTEAGSGQIGRITTAGVVTEFTIPVGSGGFSDPEGITAGPGGAMFFTDFGRSQIGRITPAGLITQFDLPVNRGPHGITAAPDGDLYFTEAASGRIGRLSASALIPGRPTSGSPPLEEFDFIATTSTPLGITTDGKGDIWFTLNAGNAVGTFLAHLEQITVTATGTTAQVYNRNREPVSRFTPFPDFRGSFRVAVADLNGNGVPDSIVGPGPGGGPLVKVFDGSDNRLLASFYAFDPAFTGGVSLAADDVNGDGRADVIVGAGAGTRTQVKVIDGMKLAQVQPDGRIADSALLGSFTAFDAAFTGGTTLSSLDFNGDGRNDIVIGAGAGGGPHVKVVDATKLAQVQADGRIADSALLASFYAFSPEFAGGVFVGVGLNDVQRKLVVGAGAGGSPHVKVIDGTKMGQVRPDGQIADSALFASFYAFDAGFRGGVRVSADDLTSDGRAELILSAGPGGGSRVVFIDGADLGRAHTDGAVLSSFFTAAGSEPADGVFIASDADHRDGPINGPPGITIANSRRDINDVFVFQSPTNPANTVLVMDVSPFSTATTPNAFAEGGLYDFRIANRNILDTTDDLVFRVTFGPPDANANGQQDAVVRALPAARFAGSGGVIVKGFTGRNVPVRGVGGDGTAQFRAAEQDDPFFFDAAGFNLLLNSPTAVDGVVAGVFPRGTASKYDGPNFFGPSVNTMSMILEIPSARLTAAGSSAIGVWGRTEFGGVQVDRMGRPAINTALIPPVPRGSNFPSGQGGPNRQDLRTAFNDGLPRDDRANFRDAMIGVLTQFYPAGRPGGTPDAAQAGAVADLLLPDVLVFDVSSSAGFGGGLVKAGGNTFLGNGRKLSDDIISTELSVLTDDDLPAGFGGGPRPPALTSQNVRDDNGANLTDGSIDPAFPQGNGGRGHRHPARGHVPLHRRAQPRPDPRAGRAPAGLIRATVNPVRSPSLAKGIGIDTTCSSR